MVGSRALHGPVAGRPVLQLRRVPDPEPGRGMMFDLDGKGASRFRYHRLTHRQSVVDSQNIASEPQVTGGDVTRILECWSAGDPQALDELVPLVYEEVHAIARRSLRRERTGHSLQPTALINEAFLRLVGQDRMQWESRGQFYAVVAMTMRRVLVGHARKRKAAKRGCDPQIVALDEERLPVGPKVDLLGLDNCLRELERLDARQARVVELRVFAECTIEETAAALGISASSVKRDWRLARIWLRCRLAEAEPGGS
jgi:RNA polymerase sigma-70 factor (ECF subfamily)